MMLEVEVLEVEEVESDWRSPPSQQLLLEATKKNSQSTKQPRSSKEFLFVFAFLAPCIAIVVCYARF